MAKPKETKVVKSEEIVRFSYSAYYGNINIIAELADGTQIRITSDVIKKLITGHTFKISKERKYFYIDEVI